MTPNDIKQEFDELDDELNARVEGEELTETEHDNIQFGMWLMSSLVEGLQERINDSEWFFLAPPTNFSYTAN